MQAGAVLFEQAYALPLALADAWRPGRKSSPNLLANGAQTRCRRFAFGCGRTSSGSSMGRSRCCDWTACLTICEIQMALDRSLGPSAQVAQRQFG